ncbi:transglutaminase domain-containing protein [Porphyromonas sp.]|uniref:transglutaminase domain-containing protein n=1 Tax=Porphyromonas sp. TaxID=1924944 RepID=UPI0026DAFE18|nr:transglutaminase domain-containing protein [Porphyromonas sp.]MDO4771328.1 transglutaminase domain-containing protein [Porphyromonas sp.]
MKKFLKIASVTVVTIAALLVLVIILARYVFRNELRSYLEKLQGSEKVALLRKAQDYKADSVAFDFEYAAPIEKSMEIKGYFRFDTLFQADADTWTKTLTLARLSALVKHDNPNPWPDSRTAIGLWEWSKNNPGGYNCRMHSILLHELLLAEGIINRVVTCMPADTTDSDCHVVNIVWLPETNKWAMIDSDTKTYVTDEEGNVLSLQEMRECIIADKPIHILPLNEGDTPGDYLTFYWAKNLYYFSSIESTTYGVESPASDRSRYIYLLPDNGYKLSMRANRQGRITTDVDRFWASPADSILTGEVFSISE